MCTVQCLSFLQCFGAVGLVTEKTSRKALLWNTQRKKIKEQVANVDNGCHKLQSYCVSQLGGSTFVIRTMKNHDGF